mmetsp:Transcript_18477/g.42527  ORF Transcript_18477/g.42527 Transcript_18477/m.42527 type:complete len:90 (+) Transcript_18477:1405-1674(+)
MERRSQSHCPTANRSTRSRVTKNLDNGHSSQVELGWVEMGSESSRLLDVQRSGLTSINLHTVVLYSTGECAHAPRRTRCLIVELILIEA